MVVVAGLVDDVNSFTVSLSGSSSTTMVNETNGGIAVEGGTDMARRAAKISRRDVQTGSTLVARWKIVVTNPDGSLRFSF